MDSEFLGGTTRYRVYRLAERTTGSGDGPAGIKGRVLAHNEICMHPNLIQTSICGGGVNSGETWAVKHVGSSRACKQCLGGPGGRGESADHNQQLTSMISTSVMKKR